MWPPILERGRLALLNGPRGPMRAFLQELAHFALHEREGVVLWCDGNHGFNPYDFAELNLTRGFDAEWGADRILIKRCMTPFQWATVLTKHVQEKLLAVEASLVVAAPYDALFSTDELEDWEQESYVRYSLRHLRDLARRHTIPILLSVDMARWWRTHPLLARMTYEDVDARWFVQHAGETWRAIRERDRAIVRSSGVRQSTIWDYTTHEAPVPREVLQVASRFTTPPVE